MRISVQLAEHETSVKNVDIKLAATALTPLRLTICETLPVVLTNERDQEIWNKVKKVSSCF